MPFRPTDDDEKLWDFVTRGAKKFLHQHNKESKKPTSVKEHTPVSAPGTVISPPVVKKSQVIQPPQLNRRDAERLRKGQMEIDATLDLHGLTQEKARAQLERFVQNSLSNGYRCLLVITGKGRISSPGVLRQKLPEWIEEGGYAGDVLKVISAHPRHGGHGAYYIYLKRR